MSLIRRLGKALKATPRINYGVRRSLAAFVSDDALSRFYFWLHHKRRLNLSAPSTFNEKVMWLKLRWRDPQLPELADKWSVREHVASVIGPEILVPAIAVVDSVDEIDYEALPERFVIKPTHGSGWVSICRDRATYDWSRERKKLSQWLRQNYYYHAREWVYRSLPPRLLIEEYLDPGDGTHPRDFKIFCFGGEPHLIQVDSDRFESHRRDMFDIAWRRLDVAYRYPMSDSPPEAPLNLDRMLVVARSLARQFPFVRVDLYSVREKVYFGELTFFPENGIGVFSDHALDARLGQLLKLPAQAFG